MNFLFTPDFNLTGLNCFFWGGGGGDVQKIKYKGLQFAQYLNAYDL